MMRTLAWRLLAVLALVLAGLGIVLPVLPTVPFLLLALAAASRGWPALEVWLLSHAVYGPTLRAWRERRAVSRRGKVLATLGMAGSSVLIWFLPLPGWLQLAVPAVLAAVAAWLWTRPES